MSALNGTIEVGDLVWQQMYSPMSPAWTSTLEERIAAGVTYGQRKVMRVLWIWRDGVDGACPSADGDSLHPLSGNPLPSHSVHWTLAVPGREGDSDHYSYVDDNWCVLELAETEGALW